MPASEQGVNRERYMLVPRTLIFLTQGEKVLLIKGAAGKRIWAGKYNGVGGHVEQGEDALTAARRELCEETGLVAQKLWLCGTITVDTGTNPGVCVFVFKGEYGGEEIGASKEGTLEWIQPSDVSLLPVVEDLPILLPKVLKMKQGEGPFSAHSSYDETGKLVTIFGSVDRE
jgi:8-oxo-dGTP diphosphatase